MPEPITSPQNEKLKLVRRLAERRGRERERLFTSEGEDLLAAGLAAGWEPSFVLTGAGAPARGSGPPATETIPVEQELLDAVSALGSGTRALAVWPLPEPAPASEEFAGPSVYLHGVADPGNVGTILRTTAALSSATVALGPGCADPWGPKAVRAAMGAGFSRPPRVGAVIDAAPAPRLALDAHRGGDLDETIAALAPRTICLGAEREGLDPAVLRACEGSASIAVRGDAESLNVAAAAAIALHRVCSAAARSDTLSSWTGGQ